MRQLHSSCKGSGWWMVVVSTRGSNFLKQPSLTTWDCLFISHKHRTTHIGRDMKSSLVSPPAQRRVSTKFRPSCLGFCPVRFQKPPKTEMRQVGVMTLHLFLLNFIRLLLIHSSSLSWSLWMAALPQSTSAEIGGPICCHLQTWWDLLQVIDTNVKEDRPQDRPLQCSNSHWYPGVPPVSHYPLSLVLQTVIYVLSCPPIQAVLIWVPKPDLLKANVCALLLVFNPARTTVSTTL